MGFGQAFYIVGLKLSSAIEASVWQPTQPLFTLVFAIALGMEKPSLHKVAGVLLAFAAVSFLTLTEYLSATTTRDAAAPPPRAGDLLPQAWSKNMTLRWFWRGAMG